MCKETFKKERASEHENGKTLIEKEKRKKANRFSS